MRKIASITLVVLFSVSIIYSQELDLSQINNNRETVKKEKKEARKKNKPTGIVISLGFGSFERDYNYTYDDVDYYYNWELGGNVKNGYEDVQDEFCSTKEIDLRIHYLFKKINLGVYLSPIVYNQTKVSNNSYYKYWDQYVGYDTLGNAQLIDNSETYNFSNASYTKAGLGSIKFGVSTNIFNIFTFSVGSGIQLIEEHPKTKLEIGTMIKIAKKLNIEYRRQLSNIEYGDGINAVSQNVSTNIFSIAYNISKNH